MTFKDLKRIMKENNIPKDVRLMSDSGWECCATDMDGVFYSRNDNTIVFTQEPFRGWDDDWSIKRGYELLYPKLPKPHYRWDCENLSNCPSRATKEKCPEVCPFHKISNENGVEGEQQ